MKEYHCEELPILYNVNIGHSSPIGILPFGTKIKVNFDKKTIHLVESPTKKRENNKVLSK